MEMSIWEESAVSAGSVTSVLFFLFRSAILFSRAGRLSKVSAASINIAEISAAVWKKAQILRPVPSG
jgi:hypothetical protein